MTAWVWGAAAGALYALCWLPLGISPLLPIALAMLIRGVETARRPREAVLCGLAQGVAQYAVGAHFFIALARYSWPAALALYAIVIAQILPYTVLQAWGAYALERRTGLPRWAGLGLLWTLFEYVRTLGDVSFPADLVSNVFGTYSGWLAWSPWIGPYGLTVLAFAVAALIHLAVQGRRRPRRAALLASAAIVLWLGPPLTDAAGETAAPSNPGRSLEVGVVQPAVDVRDKLDRRRWPQLWERLETLSAAVAPRADLVVWPETSRPGPLIWREGETLDDPEMRALAGRLGVPILYGCEIARLGAGGIAGIYNAVALVDPRRSEFRWYGKQHLLPLVEGIPFHELWGRRAETRARRPGERPSVLSLLGNFVSGPELTVFEVGGARIGALVCFEGMYPALARHLRQRGANALVLVTNDAWWGKTVFPSWHARMVAARARELGVPVIRAANSGISSRTDRDGQLVESTALAQVATLLVELKPSSERPTFYTRHGNLAPTLVALTLLAAVFRPLLFAATTMVRRHK